MRGEGAPGVRAGQPVELFDGQRPHREPAAEVGNSEPDALFAPEPQRGQIMGWLDTETLDDAQGVETRRHPGRAVVVTAARHRVEMRSDGEPRSLAVLAGQRHVEITCVIVGDLQTLLAGTICNQLGRRLIELAESGAGYAFDIAGTLGQTIKQGLGCRQLIIHGPRNL